MVLFFWLDFSTETQQKATVKVTLTEGGASGG